MLEACAVLGCLGAVRIEPPVVEHLRGDGAPLAQLEKLAVEPVAAGNPWDERGDPDVPTRTQVAVRGAPGRFRQGARGRRRLRIALAHVAHRRGDVA